MPGEWEQKAWGKRRTLMEDAYVLVEELLVDAGGYCSTHSHERKQNTFLVLDGELFVNKGETEHRLGPQESFTVKECNLHFFICRKVPARVIEISQATYGNVLDPLDINRLTEGGNRNREQQS